MSRPTADNESIQPSRPLTNLQLELLKLYGTDLPDEDLQEIKQLLAQFFARKAVSEAATVASAARPRVRQ